MAEEPNITVTYLTGHMTLDIPTPVLRRNADGSAELDFGYVSMMGDYADLARSAFDAGIKYNAR